MQEEVELVQVLEQELQLEQVEVQPLCCILQEIASLLRQRAMLRV